MVEKFKKKNFFFLRKMNEEKRKIQSSVLGKSIDIFG